MAVESFLNLIWLVAGAFALLYTARSLRRRSGSRNRVRIDLVGTALIVVALFPYISASDDVVCIQQWTDQQQHRQAPEHAAHADLLRLYETIDTAIVGVPVVVAVTVTFIGLVATLQVSSIERMTPSVAGRSPPAFSSPAV